MEKQNPYDEQKKIDAIYNRKSATEIPWFVEQPPELLISLIEKYRIEPCKSLDMGCGMGDVAMVLAKKHFDVTGIDFSPTAIQIARQKAQETNIKNVQFEAKHVTEPISDLPADFGFIYDWKLLHHIFPVHRKKYIQNVYNLLKNNGLYISVCFSENNEQFGGKGKYRTTSIDTTLYFSSAEEIETLVMPYFDIVQNGYASIPGRKGKHSVVCLVAQKR